MRMPITACCSVPWVEFGTCENVSIVCLNYKTEIKECLYIIFVCVWLFTYALKNNGEIKPFKVFKRFVFLTFCPKLGAWAGIT